MRKIVAGLLSLLTCVPGIAAASERDEVMKPVLRLLDALHRKDVAAFKAEFAPGAVVMNKRSGRIRTITADELAEKLGAMPGDISEPIGTATVHVDDDLAVVWAPYRFLRDGKVIHCGTDVLNLINVDGRWLIVGIADNARTPCS